MDKIIALIDMDCFYVQVEQRLNPSLNGKPCAVVQYNGWRGGGLIAVNYEAKDKGVGRHIRGDEAQKICPEIELVRVPEVNGKADLTKYRDAGKEVIDVITQFASCVERASVDEAYIDLTELVKDTLNREEITSDQLSNTFVVDWEENNDDQTTLDDKERKRKILLENLIDSEDGQNLGLLAGAKIVENIRLAIFEQTGFRCSAGISHNKVLSKLACGINKPNKQTVIPVKSVPFLFAKTSIKKIRNLGGKLGDSLCEHGIEMMADICKYTEKELQKLFGEKNGSWLHYLAQGIDYEPVKPRQLPQSIGCSKLFNGKNALSTIEQVNLWLGRLGSEIEQRLEKDRTLNNRMATILCLHVNLKDDSAPISRSCPLTSVAADRVSKTAYQVLNKLNKATDNVSWCPAITSLGMSATKFINVEGNCATFMRKFFQPKSQEDTSLINTKDKDGNLAKFEPQCTESSTPTQSFFSQLGKSNELLGSTSVASTSSDFNIQEYSAIAIKPVKIPGENEKLNLNNIDKDVFNDLPDDLKNEITAQLKTEEKLPSKGIAKFFSGNYSLKKNEVNNSVKETESEDTYVCDKCHKIISVWDQIEHEDYHLAMKLNSEFQATAVQRQVQSPSVSKRKIKGRHKNGPVSKTRNITSYFQNESGKDK